MEHSAPAGADAAHWSSQYALNPLTLELQELEREHEDCQPGQPGPQACMPLHLVPLKGTASLPKGPLVCQVSGCGKDLTTEKGYYQRYRACKEHLGTLCLVVNGKMSRFCQQCGKFQELHEFDDNKKSCRARLAKHNARRRKRSPPPRGGSSSSSSGKAGRDAGAGAGAGGPGAAAVQPAHQLQPAGGSSAGAAAVTDGGGLARSSSTPPDTVTTCEAGGDSLLPATTNSTSAMQVKLELAGLMDVDDDALGALGSGLGSMAGLGEEEDDSAPLLLHHAWGSMEDGEDMVDDLVPAATQGLGTKGGLSPLTGPTMPLTAPTMPAATSAAGGSTTCTNNSGSTGTGPASAAPPGLLPWLWPTERSHMGGPAAAAAALHCTNSSTSSLVDGYALNQLLYNSTNMRASSAHTTSEAPLLRWDTLYSSTTSTQAYPYAYTSTSTLSSQDAAGTSLWATGSSAHTTHSGLFDTSCWLEPGPAAFTQRGAAGLAHPLASSRLAGGVGGTAAGTAGQRAQADPGALLQELQQQLMQAQQQPPGCPAPLPATAAPAPSASGSFVPVCLNAGMQLQPLPAGLEHASATSTGHMPSAQHLGNFQAGSVRLPASRAGCLPALPSMQLPPPPGTLSGASAPWCDLLTPDWGLPQDLLPAATTGTGGAIGAGAAAAAGAGPACSSLQPVACELPPLQAGMLVPGLAGAGSRQGAPLPGAPMSYVTDELMVRVSLKIAQCEPSQLPPDLYTRLHDLLQHSGGQLAQCCVRPGCTLLTLDCCVPAPATGTSSGGAGPALASAPLWGSHSPHSLLQALLGPQLLHADQQVVLQQDSQVAIWAGPQAASGPHAPTAPQLAQQVARASAGLLLVEPVLLTRPAAAATARHDSMAGVRGPVGVVKAASSQQCGGKGSIQQLQGELLVVGVGVDQLKLWVRMQGASWRVQHVEQVAAPCGSSTCVGKCSSSCAVAAALQRAAQQWPGAGVWRLHVDLSACGTAPGAGCSVGSTAGLCVVEAELGGVLGHWHPVLMLGTQQPAAAAAHSAEGGAAGQVQQVAAELQALWLRALMAGRGALQGVRGLVTDLGRVADMRHAWSTYPAPGLQADEALRQVAAQAMRAAARAARYCHTLQDHDPHHMPASSAWLSGLTSSLPGYGQEPSDNQAAEEAAMAPAAAAPEHMAGTALLQRPVPLCGAREGPAAAQRSSCRGLVLRHLLLSTVASTVCLL